MQQSAKEILNRPLSILSLVIIVALSPMFFLTMPLYLGSLEDSLALNHSQVALIIFAEFLGVMVGSLISPLWIRKFSWKKVVFFASLIEVLGNLLSIFIKTDYSFLITVRFITGFTVGALFSVAFAGLGDTEKANRNISIATGAQLVAAGLIFFILPDIIQLWGINGAFITYLVTSAIIVLFSFAVPDSGLDLQTLKTIRGKSVLAPLWGVIGSLIFFIGYGSYWSFIERMGLKEGLSQDSIGNALGIASWIGILGSLVASWVGDRIKNYFWPMLVACLGQLFCITIMSNGFGLLEFVFAVSLYAFFQLLWIPFQISSTAQVDVSGKLVSLVPSGQTMGLALAPVLSSLFITETNFVPAFIIAGIFTAGGLLLFMPISLKLKK